MFLCRLLKADSEYCLLAGSPEMTPADTNADDILVGHLEELVHVPGETLLGWSVNVYSWLPLHKCILHIMDPNGTSVVDMAVCV